MLCLSTMISVCWRAWWRKPILSKQNTFAEDSTEFVSKPVQTKVVHICKNIYINIYTWNPKANHLQMDGSGETSIFYIKIWNNPIETTIYKWLFGFQVYIYRLHLHSAVMSSGGKFPSIHYLLDVRNFILSWILSSHLERNAAKPNLTVSACLFLRKIWQFKFILQ